jgi:nucleoside-diphosphate-sugar epimerase
MTKGRVLVTGNLGYIGSVMAPWLMKNGYDVVGLDTVYYKGPGTFIPDELDQHHLRHQLPRLRPSGRDRQGIGRKTVLVLVVMQHARDQFGREG